MVWYIVGIRYGISLIYDIVVYGCSLDQDDMYTNLKRYHQRTII